MPRIYEVILDVLRMLVPVIDEIELRDKDLARQLRRAGPSIALNTAEGSGSSGGTRRARYASASGSAQETGSCLDTAIAMGYVESVKPELLEKLDHVRAVLWKLSH
jgi:four helix bundle protein